MNQKAPWVLRFEVLGRAGRRRRECRRASASAGQDAGRRGTGELSPTFDGMYASTGRPSIPPERLLKSMLLMALYTVRSERLFCEQLDYNLLFRWFLDMDMEEPSFDPTVFTQESATADGPRRGRRVLSGGCGAGARPRS